MTLTEKLIKEFEELPEQKQAEVVDFIEFLARKEERDMENLLDAVIADNMPAFKELAK